MTTQPTQHTADDVRRMIRVAIATEGVQAKQWAKSHGLNPTLLSNVLTGRRNPTPTMLALVGMDRTTVYIHRPTPKRAA